MCAEVNPRDLVRSTGDMTPIQKKKKKKKKECYVDCKSKPNEASLVSVTESVILRKDLPGRI